MTILPCRCDATDLRGHFELCSHEVCYCGEGRRLEGVSKSCLANPFRLQTDSAAEACLSLQRWLAGEERLGEAWGK